MRVLAPAKINLHLRVGPRRDDGFHPLQTWMCTVGLFDTLTFERARTDDSPSDAGLPPLTLICNRPDLSAGDDNLIVRTAKLLRDWTSNRDVIRRAIDPIRCTLDKQIPFGAGLGGGSADAARTLVALNRLWDLQLPSDALAELAAKLGSDVPFFLHHPSAICTGRGERVVNLSAPQPRWAVLILPPIHMPTPAVYRRFDEMGLGSPNVSFGEERGVQDFESWTHLDASRLLARLVNDLEPSAFSISPELSQLRTDVERTLRRTVRMSGSGSSLFTLFDARPEAQAASELVARSTGLRASACRLAPALDDDDVRA